MPASPAPPEGRGPAPHGPGATPWRLIDPIADARWTGLLRQAHEASGLHHPAWLSLLRDRFGYGIAACCLMGPDGAVRAGLPIALIRSALTGRRLVALPFSDYCPPIDVGDGSAAAAPLGAGLDELRRQMGLDLEVRGPVGGSLAARPLARYHQHVLALDPDPSVVERGVRPSQRGGARRARREGLTAERRTDVEALAAFYDLHLATRRRLGVPCHPRRFILGLARLFERGLGFVMLVTLGRRPVAGAVFLVHGRTMTYKHSASDRRFLAKRPNDLLLLEAIRWGCESGLGVLDFGRTDIGQEGLRGFKLAWGAEERPLSYWRFSERSGPARPRALGRLPTEVLKRSPPAVSRLVGEALYRHVG